MRIHICRMAEKLARSHHTPGSRFRLGAIYCQGSRVFARGCNSNKPAGTAPNSTHAEDACLRRVPIVAGGDLYVCRALADGTIAMARPCDKCMKLIREKGVETVHYSNKNGEWKSEEIIYER